MPECQPRVGGRGRLDTAETITQLVVALDERRAPLVSSEAKESPTTDPDDPPTHRDSR